MRSIAVILSIALEHLKVRRRQTLVAVFSVALGSMIMLVTLAMMEGLLDEFRHKLLEASPPVTVQPSPVVDKRSLMGTLLPSSLVDLRRGGAPVTRDELPNYPELEALIRSIDGVGEVAPRACSPVIIHHGTRSQRSFVCGIDAVAEQDVTRLHRWMKAGRMEDLVGSAKGVILGRILAKRLSAKQGSRVRIVSPRGVVQDFRVVGIFASGITKIDDNQSYVRLGEGRLLAGLSGGAVSSISVGVTSLPRATRIAREIERKSGYEALTWEEANESAIASFRVMGVVTYFLVVFTAIVGGFGILNIMVTIVMEKTKDIAILRSMGYSARQVLGIFFGESLILGTAGGLLGLLAGTALSLFIASLPFHSTDASSIQRDQFTMLLEPSFFVISFAVSLVISVAAGVSPARRAARVDPVAVLRGER